MTTGRINRFNMYNYAVYDRMQFQRTRRAEAAQIVARNAALASSFASIQTNNIVEQGNLFSRIAVSRISRMA